MGGKRHVFRRWAPIFVGATLALPLTVHALAEPEPIVLLLAFAAAALSALCLRRSVIVDDLGVRSWTVLGEQRFFLAWSGILQVAYSRPQAPNNSLSMQNRIQLMRPDDLPLTLWGLSTGACRAILRLAAAQGVETIDETQPT